MSARTGRGPLAAALALALALCAGSCAGSRPAPPARRTADAYAASARASEAAARARAAAAVSGQPDGDADGDGRGSFDRDDARILHAGRPAGARERRAIAALFARYYAAAAAGSGARACALSYRTLVAAIPQDEATPGYGPRFLWGLKTCSQIMSRLFVYVHSEVSAPVAVAAIRIAHGHAFVLLRSQTMPMSMMEATPEARAGWRVDRLRAEGIP
jgi:hypothetical protein